MRKFHQDFVSRIGAVALGLVFAALTGLTGSAFACDAEVTFDGLAAGTVYAPGGGYAPGDWLFNEDGIDVTIHELLFPGGGSGFGGARIEPATGAPTNFGVINICRENNVNLDFDLTGLGIRVTGVRFRWLDLGGFENLRVNAAPVYAGELDMAPVAIAPGVVYGVREVPVPGGKKGVGQLRGPVRHFAVGGQEFWIDDVCVVGIDPGTGSEVEIEIEGANDKSMQTDASTWGSVKSLYR